MTTEEIKSTLSACHSVADLRACYRALAMAHHPDRGGDTATMQRINAAYHAALRALDGTEQRRHNGGQGTDTHYSYSYNREYESKIASKLSELLALRLVDCEVLLVGSWIWVEGPGTRSAKDRLKGAGMRWNAKRSVWQWSPTNRRRRYASGVSSDELKAHYGAVRIRERQAGRLQ